MCFFNWTKKNKKQAVLNELKTPFIDFCIICKQTENISVVLEKSLCKNCEERFHSFYKENNIRKI